MSVCQKSAVCLFQTRQVSHIKHWEGTCEDGTGWRFNRHRDSLDITDEELGTSIVSVYMRTYVFSVESKMGSVIF